MNGRSLVLVTRFLISVLMPTRTRDVVLGLWKERIVIEAPFSLLQHTHIKLRGPQGVTLLVKG